MAIYNGYMHTSVDKFGRVLIPKPIRDHFGLRPGASLVIEEHELEILIKMVPQEEPIEHRQGFLVFTGEIVGNIEHAVHASREEREKKLGF